MNIIRSSSMAQRTKSVTLAFSFLILAGLCGCSTDNRQQKKVLWLILTQGQSRKGHEARKRALAAELHRLWIGYTIHSVRNSKELLELMSNEKWYYNGFILQWHWWPESIDSDPWVVEREVDHEGFIYTKNTDTDITEPFLKSNKEVFQQFAENNLSPSANIVVIACGTWDDTIIQDGQEFKIREPIAQSLAKYLAWHKTVAPVYDISTVGNTYDNKEQVYGSSFLCVSAQSIWFNIPNIRLRYQEKGILLESVNQYTIKNDIPMEDWSEPEWLQPIESGDSWARPAQSKDFPYFLHQKTPSN